MFKSLIVMLGTVMLVMSVSTRVAAAVDINVTTEQGRIFVDHNIFTASARGSTNNVINFFADAGTFVPGENLVYEAVSFLKYWNGDRWDVPTRGTPPIKLTSSSGDVTFISSTDLTNFSGVIGSAGPDGSLSGQVTYNFYLPPGVVQRSPGGAYLIELALTSQENSSSTSSPYLNSDPFYFVFNSTLTATDFSKSVEALASPVPEPEGYAMLLAGLGLVGFIAGRRQRNSPISK